MYRVSICENNRPPTTAMPSGRRDSELSLKQAQHLQFDIASLHAI